jgi:Diacylglycerol kinase catalytic domain
VIIEGHVLENVLVIATVTGALIAARMAFRVHVDLPPGAAPPASRAVLLPPLGRREGRALPRGGEARRRGIEPIELRQGDDLEELVRDAVFGGADALAMAGGDGSQAIVAMVAAELGLPYACIPAGTRNHFALDLGVDRDDVVGSLSESQSTDQYCVTYHMRHGD